MPTLCLGEDILTLCEQFQRSSSNIHMIIMQTVTTHQYTAYIVTYMYSLLSELYNDMQ